MLLFNRGKQGLHFNRRARGVLTLKSVFKERSHRPQQDVFASNVPRTKQIAYLVVTSCSLCGMLQVIGTTAEIIRFLTS